MEKNYVAFTEEMKKDYTILVPPMLPMHFKMIISVLPWNCLKIRDLISRIWD